jgi:hypothetical protein
MYAIYRADKEILPTMCVCYTLAENAVPDTMCWCSEASVRSIFLFDATRLKPEPPVIIIFQIIDTRSWLIV